MKTWNVWSTRIAIVTKSAVPKDQDSRGFSLLETQAWVPAGAAYLGLTPHLEHAKRYALTHLVSGYVLTPYPWKKGPLVSQLIRDLEALPVSWKAPQRELEVTAAVLLDQIATLIAAAIKKEGGSYAR